MTQNEALFKLIEAETSAPVSDDVAALTAAIRQQGRAASILFYGSGLWNEAQDDTLYDFYVLADHIRDFENRSWQSALGALMPPNVYFMEIDRAGRKLRCKYALMSQAQFDRAARGFAASPQIWARFAQPCRIVYAKDETARRHATRALAEAAVTFHRYALPLTGEASSAEQIWLRGFAETYGAELRSERAGRTKALYDAGKNAFDARTALIVPMLEKTRRNSRPAKIRSWLRLPVWKIAAFCRLIKATATFHGAVDYALWKIERQSGTKLQATDRQRKHPLIFAWPLLFEAWRKGALR